MTRLPRHIAIIMDGNGRWAQKRGLTVYEGHAAGARAARIIISVCRELGIKALTLYAFSTENWQRPKEEVEALFKLLSRYVQQELDSLIADNIRVTVMGRMKGLSDQVMTDLTHGVEETRRNTSLRVNVAVNYGSRGELCDAAKAIAREVAAGELSIDDIDEACFARHLYVPDLPELDLLIRTSGEMRVSNFMLWQLSYAELLSMKVLWPDFRKRHLLQAIATYQSRQRRFGKR